jgi:hypothetical protein
MDALSSSVCPVPIKKTRNNKPVVVPSKERIYIHMVTKERL